jgi:hypothetical protein
MIKISSVIDSAGRRVIGQKSPRPRVYLDHWAFRDISEDASLNNRFRSALLARDGTLCISLANIVEFSQVTDRRQIALAEEFIDSLWPNIYFQNINFPEVIDIEKKRKQGQPSNGSPDSDVPIFSMFTEAAARDLCWRPTARHGLAEIARNASHYKSAMDATADLFVQRAQDVWFSTIANAAPGETAKTIKASCRISVTEPVVIALFEYLHGRNSPIKRNDVHDFSHMIVPVMYNEYVLLDGKTRHAASVVLRRLQKLYTEIDPRLGEQITNTFASVYSRSGLDQFFRDLETRVDIKKTEAAIANAAAVGRAAAAPQSA